MSKKQKRNKNSRNPSKRKKNEYSTKKVKGTQLNTFTGLFAQIVSTVLFTILLGFFFYYLHTGNIKASVWMGFLVWVSIGLTVALVLQEKLLYEPETSGVLRPANDPMPINSCEKRIEIPPNATLIFLGNSTSFFIDFPHIVIQVDKQPMLSINKASKGITISGKLYSEHKKIIAEIINNEFFINPNNYFRRERPDKSTLIIYDQQGKQVLNIRFLNPKAIRILGIFHYRNMNIPLMIEEEYQKFGIAEISQHCFGYRLIAFQLSPPDSISF